MESAEKRNRLGLTKLLLALALKHPALILELQGIPEYWKTFWTGGDFAPWASYILNYQDNDNACSYSKVGC